MSQGLVNPLPTGAATSAKQDTGNTSLTSIDGKITAVNTGAVVVSSSALPSGGATSAKQDTLLTELQLKADLTETQPVSLATVPSHAVTNAGTFATQATLQTGSAAIGKLAANSGVDIGDVDVTSAVITSGTITTVSTVTAVTSLTNALPAGTNLIGNVGHGQTPKWKTGSASATFTIVAAVASNKIKVYSLSLMTASTSAVTVTFKDGAAGTVIGTYILQAITGTNFGIAENLPIPSSLFETSVNTLLEMSFSAAVAVTYNVRYFEQA